MNFIHSRNKEGNRCVLWFRPQTRTMWNHTKSSGDEFELVSPGNIIALIENKTIPWASVEKLLHKHEDLLKKRQSESYLSNILYVLSILKSHEVFHGFGPVLNKVCRYIKNSLSVSTSGISLYFQFKIQDFLSLNLKILMCLRYSLPLPDTWCNLFYNLVADLPRIQHRIYNIGYDA